jgi:DNA-binding transcriptional LysR family regulator
LLLTGEGEQLLTDCRGLLIYATGLSERAQLLRGGDTGVLKVAASPQHIESVFSQFLHRFAERFPNVEVKVSEGSGHEILAMLERGDIHLAQNLLSTVQLDAQRFGTLPLAPVELLAASQPSLAFSKGSTIEVARLAPHPLLLLDSGFGFRRAFDAACRLAGLTPKIRMESRSPHTLLALAEAGHGIAIIPSALQTHRYQLRVVGLTYSGKLLREPLSILWDKRRPLPHYATAFCDMWAEYVREIFPITRPSEAKGSVSSKLAHKRRAGQRR